MSRARLVPLVFAVAAVTVGAPPANAAPGNCVAVQPGRPSCSVQSAGGAYEITCFVAEYCVASVDGSLYYLPAGEFGYGSVPYGTVLGVTVYGEAGVATVTTSN